MPRICKNLKPTTLGNQAYWSDSRKRKLLIKSSHIDYLPVDQLRSYKRMETVLYPGEYFRLSLKNT